MARTLLDLLAFVRELESGTPPERGVKHHTLRLLVQDLGRLADVIEWIASGEFEMAELEITNRLDSARELQRQLDELLSTPPASSDQVTQGAIRERLSLLMDRVITASVQRLPSELHRQSVSARVLRDQYGTSYQTWQSAREQLLSLRRGLELAVADLAHAYERREALATLRSQSETLIEHARGRIDELRACEEQCRLIDQQLRTLHEATLPFIDTATRTIAELERVHAAMRTFDLSVPDDIHRQMQEMKERLQEMLAHIRDAFEDPPVLERDPTLQDAIEQTDVLASRVAQILHPIRPSVFTRPLDRPEELRRLALIALCVYTDRPDSFNPKKPHRGIGKKTVADVLVIADLIDPSEFETVADDVFAFQSKDSEALAKKEKRQRWWFYRITQAGIEQTNAWLEGTLDAEDLKDRIESAITERRNNKTPFSPVNKIAST